MAAQMFTMNSAVVGRFRTNTIVDKMNQKLPKCCLTWIIQCARLVPKILTDQHKEQRMHSVRQFLEHYRKDGDNLFSHIVPSDKTWLLYTYTESKQQSMQGTIKVHPNQKS